MTGRPDKGRNKVVDRCRRCRIAIERDEREISLFNRMLAAALSYAACKTATSTYGLSVGTTVWCGPLPKRGLFPRLLRVSRDL